MELLRTLAFGHVTFDIRPEEVWAEFNGYPGQGSSVEEAFFSAVDTFLFCRCTAKDGLV